MMAAIVITAILVIALMQSWGVKYLIESHYRKTVKRIAVEHTLTRNEVSRVADITEQLFDGLLAKLEELYDADPEDKATIERLQHEVGELLLKQASQEEKYGWLNDSARKNRVARLAEKIGIGTPAPPTGPEVPVEPVDPEVPVEPVDPEVPVEPVDPEVPVEPVDPEVPVEPVDPEEGGQSEN